MQLLRLIGLVLFVTTIFLAMAAAATQTTHIRIKQPTRDANGSPLQFTAIPVIYPLVIAGGMGLLMWFVPAPLTARKPARKKRRSLSRRRRK